MATIFSHMGLVNQNFLTSYIETPFLDWRQPKMC